MRFYESDRERLSMMGYIREHSDCSDFQKIPSKKILRRYLINYESNTTLAWYLLEQYFNGNITIKDDEKLQSIERTGGNS